MEPDIEKFDLFELAEEKCYSLLAIALENLDIYNFYVNNQNKDGNTLLHIVAGQSFSVSKKLLAIGADPNIANKKREIPLHLSCASGKLLVTKALIHHNSELQVRNVFGEIPIFNAVRFNHLSILKFFKSKLKFEDIYNNKNENLLQVAVNTYKNPPEETTVTEESLQVIKYLVEEFSFDLNRQCLNGNSVLISAAKKNCLNLVEYFLDRGASINIKDSKLRNLLHLVVQQKNYKMANLLINRGINVNCQDYNGETPLHYAVLSNQIKTLMLLILKGDIDVNIQDLDGYSALHLSVSLKNLEFCKILLRNNADPALETFNRDSALNLAFSMGSTDCALLLQEQRENENKNRSPFNKSFQ